eukprot:TRINITY_DN24335_c0_g1_i1.p1 TRINITY_DN24335_c0_g1~~TRINITY_DN24335_c0_g1_i1.p1  ORF type:complete len:288 (+),score=57.88 TRINITY_DN24335_c0_g1_i1:87-950(+)
MPEADVHNVRQPSSRALNRVESESGVYSEVEIRDASPDGRRLGYAIIAPPAAEAKQPVQRRPRLPTIIAISGEEQLHVSKFFRAWRVEQWGWQVVVPLRAKSGTYYLFDPPGVELVVQFILELIADEDGRMLAHAVEGNIFHFVGSSNGAAAALAVAAKLPELAASLTLISGFLPDGLEDLSSLRSIPSIHMYVGDQDEFGHDVMLQDLHEKLQDHACMSELQVLPGASHSNVGRHIDMTVFWQRLEAARAAATLREAQQRQQQPGAASVGSARQKRPERGRTCRVS